MASIPLPPVTHDHLQDLLLESKDFDAFLMELTLYSASRLGTPQPISCAISVQRDGGLFTVASSSDQALSMDEKQYELNDGPCLTALRGGEPVMVEDLAANARWSDYYSAVRDFGVLSVLAVPIDAGQDASAALNCYAYRTSAFSPETVASIEEHAQSISRILRIALRVHPGRDPEAYPNKLREALRSRATIDAALALVMVHTRSSRDAAISLLHDAAQARNVRLRLVATDIVNGAGIPERRA
ncbi:GAF and ANTAR domain-containing protein [Arthrobacter sp. D1-29]